LGEIKIQTNITASDTVVEIGFKVNYTRQTQRQTGFRTIANARQHSQALKQTY
jgi:hypothetical protein